MRIYLSCEQEQKTVFIYGRGPKPVGASTYQTMVVPGGSALGLTYDELMALGTGEHEFPIVKKPEQAPAA